MANYPEGAKKANAEYFKNLMLENLIHIQSMVKELESVMKIEDADQFLAVMDDGNIVADMNMSTQCLNNILGLLTKVENFKSEGLLNRWTE